MSYTYGFFDAVDLGSGNYDRVYSSAEFSHYWALLVGDGVFGQPSTSLNVLATTPVAMSVKVSPGTGWIKGHYLTVPDNMDEVIAIPVANPSLPRIDSIIMALDNTDRMMKLYVRSGTAAASPTAVALQRDADIWELELAQVTVAAGAGNIAQTAIKDMRTDPNRCGIVTGLIDQFDVSGFFTAAQASFDEWFENVKGQLGDDVAGNLQNQINQLDEQKADLSLVIPLTKDKFTLSATYTEPGEVAYQIPTGATELVAVIIGGGGSGAACAQRGGSGNTHLNYAGGGGSGEIRYLHLKDLSGLSSLSGVVGKGGDSVEANSTSVGQGDRVQGNNGETSSLNGTSAPGGEGGLPSNTDGTTSWSMSPGSSGGVGSDSVTTYTQGPSRMIGDPPRESNGYKSGEDQGLFLALSPIPEIIQALLFSGAGAYGGTQGYGGDKTSLASVQAKNPYAPGGGAVALKETNATAIAEKGMGYGNGGGGALCANKEGSSFTTTKAISGAGGDGAILIYVRGV